MPDIWLMRNTKVADSIFWEDNDGPKKWSEWSPERKKELRDAFWETTEWFKNGRTGPDPVDFNDPLDNVSPDKSSPELLITQAFSADDAWSAYLAYLAWGLSIEIQDLLPWSLTDYDSDALEMLFNSQDWYFFFENEYWMMYNCDAVPAPPAFTLRFIEDNGIAPLLGGDPKERMKQSIAMLLEWCRDNLVHFHGYWYFGNMFNHFWYLGYPPVSRIVNSTKCNDRYRPFIDFHSNTCTKDRQHHWTGGCQGTVGVIKQVLRAINIPVLHFSRCEHGQAYFGYLNLYLPDGDLPYGSRDYLHNVVKDETKVPPYKEEPVPIEHLLIDPVSFENFFPSDLSEYCLDVRNINTDRGLAEVTIEYLTNIVLKNYCEDVLNNPEIDFFNGTDYNVFFSELGNCNKSCLCRAFKEFLFSPGAGCESPDDYGIRKLIPDWMVLLDNLDTKVQQISGMEIDGCTVVMQIPKPTSTKCD